MAVYFEPERKSKGWWDYLGDVGMMLGGHYLDKRRMGHEYELGQKAADANQARQIAMIDNAQGRFAPDAFDLRQGNGSPAAMNYQLMSMYGVDPTVQNKLIETTGRPREMGTIDLGGQVMAGPYDDLAGVWNPQTYDKSIDPATSGGWAHELNALEKQIAGQRDIENIRASSAARVAGIGAGGSPERYMETYVDADGRVHRLGDRGGVVSTGLNAPPGAASPGARNYDAEEMRAMAENIAKRYQAFDGGMLPFEQWDPHDLAQYMRYTQGHEEMFFGPRPQMPLPPAQPEPQVAKERSLMGWLGDALGIGRSAEAETIIPSQGQLDIYPWMREGTQITPQVMPNEAGGGGRGVYGRHGENLPAGITERQVSAMMAEIEKMGESASRDEIVRFLASQMGK